MVLHYVAWWSIPGHGCMLLSSRGLGYLFGHESCIFIIGITRPSRVSWRAARARLLHNPELVELVAKLLVMDTTVTEPREHIMCFRDDRYNVNYITGHLWQTLGHTHSMLTVND
jgi:hypothetical protein